MHNFTGEFFSQITDNYLITIPDGFFIYNKKFNEFILTKSIRENCLIIYQILEWNLILKELESRLDEKLEGIEIREILKELPDKSFKINLIDNSKQFIIPDKFLYYFGNEKEIVFLGIDGIIELWSKKSYHEII